MSFENDSYSRLKTEKYIWGLSHCSSGKSSINVCWSKCTWSSICQRLTHHYKAFTFWHARRTSVFNPAVCSPLLPQGQFLSHLTHLHILTTDKRKEKHTSLYPHTNTTSLQKPFGVQPRTRCTGWQERKSYCSSFKRWLLKQMKSPLHIPQPASDVFSVDSPPLTSLEKSNENMLSNVSFCLTKKKVSHAGL